MATLDSQYRWLINCATKFLQQVRSSGKTVDTNTQSIDLFVHVKLEGNGAITATFVFPKNNQLLKKLRNWLSDQPHFKGLTLKDYGELHLVAHFYE